MELSFAWTISNINGRFVYHDEVTRIALLIGPGPDHKEF